MNTAYLTNSPVALVIGMVTLAASLYLLIADQRLFLYLMLHPYSFVRGKRRYSLLTSGLIHADFSHLLFNMFSFYFFAFALEAYTGHWQFAVIYLVSLMTADIPTIIRHRNNPDYACLGASGAVTAAIFSFIIYEPRARIALALVPIGIPAPIFAVLYVAFCYYGTKARRGRINHEAHLWGAVSGLVLTALLDPTAYAGFWKSVTSLLQP